MPKPEYHLLNKSINRDIKDVLITMILILVVASGCLFMFEYANSLRPEQYEEVPHINVQHLTYRNSSAGFTWACENNKCVKQRAFENDNLVSLDSCYMLCTPHPLWPNPKKYKIENKKSSNINVQEIIFNTNTNSITSKIDPMLKNAFQIFQKGLENLSPSSTTTTSKIKLEININCKSDDILQLRLTTNESYFLSTTKNSHNVVVIIKADTYFGARHGLETLSQLIWWDKISKELRILHDVEITDSPSFPYRGIMIDTARNYFEIAKLKSIVDGMAMSKLNALHLHLTDATSFPMVLPNLPELAHFGAYSPEMVYTSQDIKDLREYSKIRGVRLILEIDAPGHVNAGWNYAEEIFNETYVICGEKDVFNGHFNPDNDNVFQALETIYRDLLELNGNDEIFHIGGDEVNLKCWAQTGSAKNKDLLEFWASYTNKMLQTLKKANGNKFPDNIILWSSPLTESKYLKDLVGNVTVQLWLGNSQNIVHSAKTIIYSHVDNWYLDCGFGPWKMGMSAGVCDPYRSWQKFYSYRPWDLYNTRDRTLGGEVCLWTEEVDGDTLETRVWPRAAAFAERVWTDPVGSDDYDLHTRFVAFRERILARGVKASAIWPRWCSQNPGRCGPEKT